MSSPEWDNRRLCPDGGWVGVLGDDGVCKSCGKAGGPAIDKSSNHGTPASSKSSEEEDEAEYEDDDDDSDDDGMSDAQEYPFTAAPVSDPCAGPNLTCLLGQHYLFANGFE